jgi:hypothetical protein
MVKNHLRSFLLVSASTGPRPCPRCSRNKKASATKKHWPARTDLAALPGLARKTSHKSSIGGYGQARIAPARPGILAPPRGQIGKVLFQKRRGKAAAGDLRPAAFWIPGLFTERQKGVDIMSSPVKTNASRGNCARRFQPERVFWPVLPQIASLAPPLACPPRQSIKAPPGSIQAQGLPLAWTVCPA